MIRKRRTASVARHEISRPVEPATRKRRVSDASPGLESQLDRARYLNYAALALEGPAGPEPPSSGAQIETLRSPLPGGVKSLPRTKTG